MSISSVTTPTKTTAALIAEIQEKRHAETAARIRAQLERERKARQELITRSGVGYEHLVTTYRTLREIARINLDDLQVPPGFNLLPDGEVGSVNSGTPEWQFWSMLDRLAEDAQHLADVLLRASDELKVDGHWDGEPQ